MKQFVTFLMVASVMMLLPQKMMAEKVTLHFFVPADWNQVGVWVYDNDSKTNYCNGQPSWPGEKPAIRTTAYGVKVVDWTGDITGDIDKALVIFNNGVEGTQTQTDNNGFRVVKDAYYDFNGLTDSGFEMVASYGGKDVVLQLSASRLRDGVTYCTDAYTVGFKDEVLPGVAGSKVKVYVRGKNQKSLQFRPVDDGSTFGDNLVDANTKDTNLTFYGTETCMDFDAASQSSNAFVITKGEGVSYTIALYNGANSRERITASGNDISYCCASRSLSLYVNKPVVDTYIAKYGQGYQNGTTKNTVEDYYLIGNWSTGDNYSTDATDNNKMVKQVFLNPIETNKVDSIVYSKVVKKLSSGFGNLYLSFAPASLTKDNSNSWGTDNVYSAGERYNFIARAEVQDQLDATAQEGAVLISGYNNTNDDVKVCNGQQAINPLVTTDEESKYNYYIVRFNATTSTYRIEFVDSPYLEFGSDGIRTYCGQLNLKIPEGYKAYVAHDYKKAVSRESLGIHGNVEMRRLKYIPANEGVVIVADQTTNGTSQILFPVITDADEDSPITTVEEDWWYYSDRYKANNEKFQNYLVASLFGTTVESGRYTVDENNRYTYATRHFALNKFFNTKTYKENKDEYQDADNYIGFFRLAGTVPAGYAYLSLPSDVMDFDGQLLGDFDSNRDDIDADKQVSAKMLMSFDDFSDDNSVTAIENVKKNSFDADGAYYTLQGIKVVNPSKGIYVHNGKKIVIK